MTFPKAILDNNSPKSDLQADELSRRARLIKLVLMDCDGVLTDGRLWLTEDYDEHKGFHARDGLGISLLHRAGLHTGIISGRKSRAVDYRARELQMAYVHQYAKDKVEALNEIATAAGLVLNECAFIGDDVPDIAVMRRVGFAVAVADAVDETKQAAHYVTAAKGGHGAVREACEFILKAQGRWDELIRALDPAETFALKQETASK